MSASRRASSTGASSAIRTQSAPSSVLHVEDLGVDVDGVVDDHHHVGLRVEVRPGAVDELVELERSRISHGRRSTPSGRRVCLRDLGLDVQRRLARAARGGRCAPHELADLGLQRGVGDRLGAGARARPRRPAAPRPRATRRALRASSIWRISSSRSAAGDRGASRRWARPRTGRRGRSGRSARRAGSSDRDDRATTTTTATRT